MWVCFQPTRIIMNLGRYCRLQILKTIFFLAYSLNCLFEIQCNRYIMIYSIFFFSTCFRNTPKYVIFHVKMFKKKQVFCHLCSLMCFICDLVRSQLLRLGFCKGIIWFKTAKFCMNQIV